MGAYLGVGACPGHYGNTPCRYATLSFALLDYNITPPPPSPPPPPPPPPQPPQFPYQACAKDGISMQETKCLISLVPSPLRRERKGSGQMCVEPLLPVQPRVCTNQIQVLRSHDVKNTINSHCTRLCSLYEGEWARD